MPVSSSIPLTPGVRAFAPKIHTPSIDISPAIVDLPNSHFMKRYHSLSALAAAVLAPSALAFPITWTGTAAVTSVTATAFPGVTVGDPVAVEFSYDSGCEAHGLSFLPIGGAFKYKTEFTGDVDLKMSVTIGGQVWRALLPVSAPNGVTAILSDAWDGGGSPDKFAVTVSSAEVGDSIPSFPDFPYQGINTARQIEVTMNDTVGPCLFMTGTTLPNGKTPVGEITTASGAIRAGNQFILFTLAPASIRVSEPPIPLTFQRTGGGISLRWPGVEGASYRLEECDELDQWVPVSVHPGQGVEIVVSLTPFAQHPKRRFYRVVQL